jgi:peptidase S41-like protein
MKIGNALLLIVGLAVCRAPAQTANPKLDSAVLHQDSNVLQSKLTELHPSLFRYATREELEKAFRRIHERIRGPMDDVEFFREIASLSAVIRDGHTEFSLSESAQARATTVWPLLPARFRFIEDKLFVWRDYGTTGESLAGGEIKSINGKPVTELMEKIISMCLRDGSIATSPRRWLEQSFRLNTFIAVEAGVAAKYVVEIARSEGGRVEKHELSGVVLSELKRLARERHPQDWPTAPAYELNFLNDNAIAILIVRSFDDSPGLPPLADFYVTAFRQIEERHARALIIDVRNNGGGRDDLGKLLLAHLLDRPFDYYEGIYSNPELIPSKDAAVRNVLGEFKFIKDSTGQWRLSSHPNFGRQRPVAPVFHGKVIVLMNGASFSTTAEFLTMCRTNNRAIFIGEEAGGANCGDTCGVEFPFTLPNSRVRVTIPLMRYEMARHSGDRDRGVIPDVPVSDSIADLLAGHDRVLQTAIDFVNAKSQEHS